MSSGNGSAVEPAARLARSRVVITRANGHMARLVAERLGRLQQYHVVGIGAGRLPDPSAAMEYHQLDSPVDPVGAILRHRDVEAVIDLGAPEAPDRLGDDSRVHDALDTARLLDACVTHSVRKVIVLSSASVYGPRPENTQFLREDAPLRASPAYAWMRDTIDIDAAASSFMQTTTDIAVTILRPVHILGRLRSAASNYLRRPIIPTLLGFDPMMQVIHEQDVAEVIACALSRDTRGIYNVTGPGQIPLSVIIRELGRRRMPIPHLLAGPLWRLAVGRAGKADRSRAGDSMLEADFVRFVCMVDGSRARAELGFQPRFGLRESIRAVD
ncbi:MAG: NAD-dependent epimerase/dehydratase family protein [Proteobacteria bacterium]|nr:NAD-dependent epimerase/dehydratase family protein [Pseudomonadota bacterium]